MTTMKKEEEEEEEEVKVQISTTPQFQVDVQEDGLRRASAVTFDALGDTDDGVGPAKEFPEFLAPAPRRKLSDANSLSDIFTRRSTGTSMHQESEGDFRRVRRRSDATIATQGHVELRQLSDMDSRQKPHASPRQQQEEHEHQQHEQQQQQQRKQQRREPAVPAASTFSAAVPAAAAAAATAAAEHESPTAAATAAAADAVSRCRSKSTISSILVTPPRGQRTWPSKLP
jgi:hypothetical protein